MLATIIVQPSEVQKVLKNVTQVKVKILREIFTQLEVQVSGQKHTWVKVKYYYFKLYSSIKVKVLLFSHIHTEVWLKG